MVPTVCGGRGRGSRRGRMLRRLWLVGSSGCTSEHRTLLSVVSSLVEHRDDDAGCGSCGSTSDSGDHTGVPDPPSCASAQAQSELVFGAGAETQTGIRSCDVANLWVERPCCSDAEVQTDTPCRADAGAQSDGLSWANGEAQTDMPSCADAGAQAEMFSCANDSPVCGGGINIEGVTDLAGNYVGATCQDARGLHSSLPLSRESVVASLEHPVGVSAATVPCWKPRRRSLAQQHLEQVQQSVEQHDSGACWKPKRRPAVEPQPEEPWRPWNCRICGGCVAVFGQAGSFKRPKDCLACGGRRLLCRPHRAGKCVHCHGYSERLCTDCQHAHCCDCKKVVVPGSHANVAPAAPRVDTAVGQITAAGNSQPSSTESRWQLKGGMSGRSFGHDPTLRTKPRAKLRLNSTDTVASTAAPSIPSVR